MGKRPTAAFYLSFVTAGSDEEFGYKRFSQIRLARRLGCEIPGACTRQEPNPHPPALTTSVLTLWELRAGPKALSALKRRGPLSAYRSVASLLLLAELALNPQAPRIPMGLRVTKNVLFAIFANVYDLCPMYIELMRICCCCCCLSRRLVLCGLD